MDELEPLIKQKNITIELNNEPLFPIEGDETLLKEVLLNLIQNAIQYSYQNSVIKISLSETIDNFIQVRIQDHGIGIDSNELPFIFEKFYRTKNAEYTSQGSGLGLYLVKYFLELHHGKIEIQSSPNQGTLAIISLPIEQPKRSTLRGSDE